MANLHDNLKTNMAAIVNKAYCTRQHLFLEYMSKCSKLPGGGSTTSGFEVRWLGVMCAGEKEKCSSLLPEQFKQLSLIKNLKNSDDFNGIRTRDN